MRNLILVLDEIIKLIPEKKHEEFKENLVKIRDKASYAAPEITYSLWNEIGRAHV
jgi:hypothetical protein